jgi:hypothetical protein
MTPEITCMAVLCYWCTVKTLLCKSIFPNFWSLQHCGKIMCDLQRNRWRAGKRYLYRGEGSCVLAFSLEETSIGATWFRWLTSPTWINFVSINGSLTCTDEVSIHCSNRLIVYCQCYAMFFIAPPIWLFPHPQCMDLWNEIENYELWTMNRHLETFTAAENDFENS